MSCLITDVFLSLQHSAIKSYCVTLVKLYLPWSTLDKPHQICATTNMKPIYSPCYIIAVDNQIKSDAMIQHSFARRSSLNFLEDTPIRSLCYHHYIIVVSHLKLSLTFREPSLLRPTSHTSCIQIIKALSKPVVLNRRCSVIINKATTATLTKGWL